MTIETELPAVKVVYPIYWMANDGTRDLIGHMGKINPAWDGQTWRDRFSIPLYAEPPITIPSALVNALCEAEALLETVAEDLPDDDVPGIMMRVMAERIRATLSQHQEERTAVKALEWTAVGKRFDAHTFFGIYSVCDLGNYVHLRLHPGMEGAHVGEAYHSETLDEAKAAAQADYERRIRSALVPSTPAKQKRDLGITKEWFERRAKAEADLEIGVGFSVVNMTDADIAQMEVLAERALPKWAEDELARLRAIALDMQAGYLEAAERAEEAVKAANALQIEVDRHRATPAASRCEELVKALKQCQSVLAMFIDPDTIMETTVLNAYALATAAEAKARALIQERKATDDLKEAEGVGK